MTVSDLHATPPQFPAALAHVQDYTLRVGIVAAVLSLLGAFVSPAEFFRSYLFSYLFWLGIALGSLAIVMLQYLSGGAWGVVTRRIFESSMSTLPYMALLFVPLLFGLQQLYIWARPEVMTHDAALQTKDAYLNVSAFLLRALVYFGLWTSMAYLLVKWSQEQDQHGDTPTRIRQMRLLSGPGLIVYGLAVTFASVDWLMSLEPHWYSTIFGALTVVGQGLTAFAFTIAVLAVLIPQTSLSAVISPKLLRDLGGLLFAFVMLWAYMSFSQYLLIWSGNLPEEVSWYTHRLRGGWRWVGVLLVVFHFAIPFAFLLSSNVKRNPKILGMVAVLILFMRLVDLFWLVTPTFVASIRIHWLDIVTPVAFGSAWLTLFLRQLQRAPLVPIRDTYLPEALAYGRS